MKKLIKLMSLLTTLTVVSGCTTSDNYPHKQYYNNSGNKVCQNCGDKHCNKHMHKKSNKLYSKMYTRNNHNEATEIGYVKFYDVDDGVKMVVNVDKLRNNIDYTTKISQCTDAKCTNPDTCCKTTTMSLEMPLTRKDKSNSMLQETFFIKNVNTGQLQGATIFFERDKGYRAAWGFID